VRALSALNFDLSVYDIFGVLAAGGTIILPEAAGARDPAYWAELCVQEGVTLWNSVPAFMELAVDHAEADSPESLRTLRAVLMSGDWIPVTLPERIKRVAPGAAVTSLGGATEASIWSILYPIERTDPGWRSIPYGRPMKNQRFYVLDAALEPCPIGVEGALYIGGVGVALGYWRNEGITKAAFIEHPRTGERLYRTGDLGRYMADGVIEFLGRKDFQVKIRGFRIELGEIEVALGLHPEVREAVVVVREDVPGDRRLAAYVVAREGSSPSADALRGYLKERLPEYMVPPVVVLLDAMPLTPNGKVDRLALPAPDGAPKALGGELVEPRTPIERKLADVWAQVLGVERVGIHDSFFALGGDSILAIQVVSRARRAELMLQVRQLFQHPTIAALAKVAVAATGPRSEQRRVTGAVPLTPIQQWFFEQQRPEPHHFNQAVLLTAREPLDVTLLEEALAHLVGHHDALRLCFPPGDGGVTQVHTDIVGRVPVAVVDLSAVPAVAQAAAMEAAASEAQASLRLDAAPLLRVVLFTLGSGRESRLLIVIHHLVIDGVSWRILLEDLEAAYRQRLQSEPMQLPFKTTSFQQWAEQLVTHARTDAVRDELGQWLAAPLRSPLPRDLNDGENTVASARTVEMVLSAEETQALLQDVPEVYRTQINDVLLTALIQAVASWAGSRSLRVDLEGHGREEIGGDLDLSRTIGWFTALYPVALELVPGSLGEALKAVKEQLRHVPSRGIGYGLLRYLHPDPEVRDALKALPQAEVIFNYLGQLDQDLSKASLFELSLDRTGQAHSPRGLRYHLLEVNAWIAGGRFRVGWTYSEHSHRQATIAELAERFLGALTALIAHCRSPGAGGRTLSDFPLAKLPQTALDRLVGTGHEVEDLYPLSPMQQGMLFHTLQEPSSGVYVEQMTFRLSGGVHVDALKTAWQQVIAHHPILRTAFAWEGLERPVQIVRLQVDLPWIAEDWRDRTPDAQEQRLSSLLAEDRIRGFDVTQAPLLRLALLRLGDDIYQVVFSYHHLLLDGWAMPLVFKDLLAFYEAACEGKTLHLEPSPPYRDYIAWLGRQDAGRIEAFWREVLRGFRAPTSLSVARALPPASEHHGEYRVQDGRLPERPMAALVEVARAHGLTVNALLQGAWALLLARYSREEDVVFGGIVSGRSAGIEGMDAMVGLFINTLPVRARVDPRAPLLTLAQALQQRQAEQLPYEYGSLAEIQRWSEIPPGQPLFSSILVVENYPVFGQERLPFEVTDVRSLEQTNYPLTVVAVPGREMFLRFSYEVDRFDDATISRMMGHFQRLLVSISEAPERRISELSLLTPEELLDLTVTRNDTRVEYPDPRLVHELYEAQVSRSPEAVAVVFESEQLTYRELNERANRLAHHLRELGVGPEVLVGICVERSLEMVIGLMGILKAGGAYVPLDPSYPRERLDFMIHDVQATVLLTQTHLRELIPDMGAKVICLDAEGDGLAQKRIDNPSSGVGDTSLAYMIYTSGSTGRPKGAMNIHAGFRNRLQWMQQAYQLTASDVVLQKTPYSFDVSVWEFFWPLMVGARLVVARPEGHRDSAYLAQLINQQGVTTLHFVPSMLHVFLDELGPGKCKSLKRVLCSGEALSFELTERFFARSEAELHNLYGPTEASIDVTSWACERDAAGKVIPIGRPIANTQLYVLDARLSPVPLGVPGELSIGGVQLGRGYWRRADLTAERFIPDPFSARPGARLYRTGDLSRWLPDGSVEYLGRIDYQVKLRGFRIELGEIEAALGQHPGVREAVVLTREDTPGDMRLVAYLVACEVPAPGGGELWSWLQHRLPEYMVPGVYVFLDAMPLTPSGKIDRRSLPAPDRARGEPEAALSAPRTPLEELLAGIWAQVLGVERVGIHDNFFALGGHSLLATQVFGRLRAALGIELPLRTLFEAPTVSALAERSEAARRGGVTVQAPPLVRVPRGGGELPLSFAQQRLWFLDQLEPESPFYNMAAVVHFLGSLDVSALEQSLREVVRRHEGLRTTFLGVDGRPRQIIAEEPSLTLPVIDLSALLSTAQEAERRRLTAEEGEQPFNLAKGPLLRTKLLRLSDTEHVLLLTMHHIISDGWSTGVLVREFTALYEAFQAGKPSPLPELPLQYADFAVWQRQWLDGEVLEAQLAYWKRQLGGELPILELSTDRPRPAMQTFRGAVELVSLPKDLCKALTALSQREGVTLFMTLLATFQLLLHRYSGQDDIVVGSPIASRTSAETEGLIGLFVNTLVLRTDLSGELTFSQLLGRVREVTLGAYAHQEVPFEKLVEALQPERDLSRSPLFQVMFTLQNTPLPALELAGMKIRPMEVENTTAKFDLELIFEDTDDGMLGTLEYNTDLFDAATAAQMLGHYRSLLTAVTASPERRLSDLPFLTAPERSQLLLGWNDTFQDVPHNRSFQELFEAQVQRTPEAVAAVFSDQRLTYRELNRRANRLAHHLRGIGVGRDVVVALLMERSLELLISILAVFKAGGAYLPLDPDHPAGRILKVLEQSGALQVVATRAFVPMLSGALRDASLERSPELLEFEALAQREQSEENPPRRGSPGDLAYVIYTSGSTGVPKGAMVEQRGMVNHLFAKVHELDLTAAEVVAESASQCFDISVWQFLSALIVGGRVHVLEDEEATDPRRLLAAIEAFGITLLEVVPSLLRIMLDDIKSRGGDRPGLPSLRCLVLTGEALPPELCREWSSDYPTIPLLNAYGPTECSDDVSHHRITAPPGDEVVYTPIGRPVINTQLYVLDRSMQPVPVGVAGELYVGGTGVGRGYLRDPKRTSEVFFPDPFAQSLGARLYKTGDRVRRLPGGDLVFLGRVDHQVKIRGFRIELGEIEVALKQHPAVHEAIVLAREDTPGDKRLVAYVTSPDAQPVGADELRRHVKERLPDYMVPSAVVVLQALPLTPNGKVDRRALPAPDGARSELHEDFVAPRSPVEEALANIWKQVLRVERVGVHDNFFSLGGHSLLATQVVARVRETFSVELPLRHFFATPTLEGLATTLVSLRAGHTESQDVEKLLSQVRGLSEEEIQALLASGGLPEEDEGKD
jgi:amino acid adenylation domain-containing protein/non-ribosomal peptide synthase protein (TIGR01720 family)